MVMLLPWRKSKSCERGWLEDKGTAKWILSGWKISGSQKLVTVIEPVVRINDDRHSVVRKVNDGGIAGHV